ncbi:RCC1 domain-containing protein [Paenibacillus graminis]|uniref:RCC1 domain-containing protein n=1 Tax=Paenibacillus graminis TaxID=189425 RepID=UPI00046E7BBD
MKSDGTVWGWGNNSNNQLGDGTNTQRLTPVKAVGLSGITAIVAKTKVLALKNDGTVWKVVNSTFAKVDNLSGVQTDRLRSITPVSLEERRDTLGMGNPIDMENWRMERQV